MPETVEAKALRLSRMIERASLDSEAWPEFLGALAAEIGDPAIALNLELIPGQQPARLSYRVNSDPRYGPVYAELSARGELPWRQEQVARDHFQSGRDFISDADLAEHRFYREYMKPQGLAPEAPLGLVFGVYERQPVAAMGIYRREGCRTLGADDLALLDAVVPSLVHAYRVHFLVGRERQQREALAEALDRFSSGVVLLDEDGQAVSVSQGARRIAALEDGFSLEGARPSATDRASAARLRDAIERATQTQHDADSREDPVGLERPSGRRPLVALATSLRAVPRVGYARDAVAALFVTDPEVAHVGLREHLVALYGLTAAEADIASLLCLGRSVEATAEARGVTINTARGQLKQIFAKTGTSRQSDLVRLALTSYAGIRELPEPAVGGDDGPR
jgi:DNA-binding CsgD family transcriptional regulator